MTEQRLADQTMVKWQCKGTVGFLCTKRSLAGTQRTRPYNCWHRDKIMTQNWYSMPNWHSSGRERTRQGGAIPRIKER